MAQAPNNNAQSRTALALLIIAIIAALYLAREVFIPIALAVLVAFLLTPPVRALERLRFPRALAIAIAVGFSAVLAGGLLWVVERQVFDLAAKLPEYKTSLLHRVHALRPAEHGVLDKANTAISEIGKELSAAAQPETVPLAPTAASSAAPVPVTVIDTPTPSLIDFKAMFGSVLSQVVTAGIVLLFAVALLAKREDIRNRLVRLVGVREMHLTTPALDDAGRRVSRYLLLQVVTNAALGLIIGLGLYFLGVPGAPLFGVVIAVLRFIPYVGVWIGAALPVALSLATAPGWTQPLLVLGLIAVTELLIANLAEPLLFGAGTGVSALAILFSAVFWGWLWGPVGLVVATPLTVCLAVLGSHVPRLAFLGVLLSDEPALSPEAGLYQRLLAGDPDGAARLVTEFAKGKPLVDVCDNLLLPALRLAESDRHRDQLTPEQESIITDLLRAIIDDLAVSPHDASPTPTGRILILPSRDPADELTARLLLLSLPADLSGEALSSVSFTSELVDRIAKGGIAAVCISALPPEAAFHARVLCKRIRARFPALPIVVGFWDSRSDPASLSATLAATSGEHIATTLQQAVTQLHSLASLDTPPQNGAAHAAKQASSIAPA